MMSADKIITIKICTGTLCHVMGGSNLPELAIYLPDSIRSSVEIKGMVCGQFCKDSTKKPPFVTIDDVLMEQASIEKIINHIEKALCNDTK